jgi:hypothetical protein
MGKQKVKGSTRDKRKAQRKRRRRRWTLWLLLAVAVAGGHFFWVNGPGASRPPVLADAAPSFTLAADTGRDISLADYSGKKPVVVLFYMLSN